MHQGIKDKRHSKEFQMAKVDQPEEQNKHIELKFKILCKYSKFHIYTSK